MNRLWITPILLIANAHIVHSQWTTLHPSVLDSTKLGWYANACTFVSKDSGFILSGVGFSATSDGGDTWKLQSSFFSGTDEPISFPNLDDGWIGDARNYFRRTTDGGVSWVKDSNLQTNQFTFQTSNFALYFQDSQIGWEGYENFSIFSTTNGGNKWQLRHSETDNVLDLSSFTVRQIAFCNSMLGLALVDNGAHTTFILRTSDGGATWQDLSPDHYHPIAGGTPTGLVYIDPHHAWLCTGNIESQLWKSTDSGLTWSRIMNVPSPATFQSMSFADTNHGLIAAGGSGTYAIYTINGGQSWRTDRLSGFNFCSASFPDTSVAYVASGYSLYRLSTADLAVQSLPQVTIVPSIEIVNGTLIVMNLNERDGKLQIFDILGREVLHGNIPTYGKLEIDISSLPSGLYFVTDGNWRGKFAKE